MSQLFYNITGGIVHKILKIRREKRTTMISEVIVRGKQNIKQNRNWFYFNSRILYLTILERKNLSFPLKVETDQFVLNSVKICCILPSDSEANRDDTDAEFPFPLFSLFLPHLRTLAHEKSSGNCVCFGTSWPSLCLYALL